uniref:Uncharacterized protein n=1 Tax=Anopheles albimanus TaxID=7167 RepID=A0A182FVX0_ANOAL
MDHWHIPSTAHCKLIAVSLRCRVGSSCAAVSLNCRARKLWSAVKVMEAVVSLAPKPIAIVISGSSVISVTMKVANGAPISVMLKPSSARASRAAIDATRCDEVPITMLLRCYSEAVSHRWRLLESIALRKRIVSITRNRIST